MAVPENTVKNIVDELDGQKDERYMSRLFSKHFCPESQSP